MLFCWHRLSPCLVLFWLCSSSALCPSNCTCKVTEKGRRKVSCTRGAMVDPVPTAEMDPGMEVLEISAPESPESWNRLTITALFQGFKHLEELHICRSRVLQISMHAFWGVPTLKLLDLSCNNISSLSDHNFRGLLNLLELNLDDNCVRDIQSGAFKHLTELRILTMRRNMFSELVPRMFLKLAKLHVLKLSGNQFEELTPEVFKDVPDLRVLECRSCGLRRINTQIYHLLPYLSHLDLGDNQMHFLAADEFHDLRHLHTLKLDGNQFPVVLEHTFVRQQQLKFLCLARNRLAKVTNTAFLNLTSLVDLDIGFNKLDKLEVVSLQPISETLQRLVISGNYFSAAIITRALQTVFKVVDLEIARMGLKQLPSNLLPDRIRRLNISLNNLTELSVESLPRKLQDLDFSGNALKGLDDDLVFRLESLKTVRLDSNPWSCSLCNLAAVIFRLNRTNVFANLTCASPKPLASRSISALRLEELPPCKEGLSDEFDGLSGDSKLSLAIGISSLLVFLSLCVAFVVCSCRKKQRARHVIQEQKRHSEQHGIQRGSREPVADFSKGEITFKFPLDLTERQVSVSTIDGIKKENLPNGTGI